MTFTHRWLLILVIMASASCATGKLNFLDPHRLAVPPPLPEAWRDGQRHLDYYPDASKRAHEQGRVVLKLHIGPTGALDGPLEIDPELTAAPPRLQEAALKIMTGIRFAVGSQYKTLVTASIVFELEPCGTVNQDSTVDYRINLCLDPSPYTAARLAASPPTAFEQAVTKVLVHGDLADIDFLEETLGLRFRVTRPVRTPWYYGEDHGLHVLVTPTVVPHTIKVMGLSYEYSRNPKGDTRFDLRFEPTECPDIALWAARSKIPSTSSMATHGAGTGTDFRWGGNHGIGVSAFRPTGGGCNISLTQTKENGAPYSSHTDTDLISPQPLLQGISAMIASGDIRDIARTGRLLHSSFKAYLQGPYGDYYELESIIPGVEPTSFEYSVHDTGLQRGLGPDWFALPPVQASRTARFSIDLGIYHLCIRLPQLPSALHRRGVHFSHLPEKGKGTYLIRRKNEIRVRAMTFNGCIQFLVIDQITDVKHSVIPVPEPPGPLPLPKGKTSIKQSSGAVSR